MFVIKKMNLSLSIYLPGAVFHAGAGGGGGPRLEDADDHHAAVHGGGQEDVRNAVWEADPGQGDGGCVCVWAGVYCVCVCEGKKMHAKN